MSHQSNWKELGLPTGQDKPSKEPVQQFDKNYGTYKQSDDGKPTKAIMPLPGEPTPFVVKK